ncbi:MAG: polysaccharide lyase [Hyphomicrobiaceae bacterium]|nr:hypothetical protein [Hyphomicrobiaceae bacterium]
MKRFSNKFLAINIVGGVIMVSAAVTMVKQVFARPHVEVCTERYGRILAMRLDKSGRPMEPAEFQAATNGLDRGVLENLKINTLPRGPAAYAMAINVANANATELIPNGEAVADGVTFPWTPRANDKGATTACLTYHVMLPAEYDFQAGSTLPGIFGVTDGGSLSDINRVETNILLSAQGVATLRLYAKTATGQSDTAVTLYDRQFPVGRWVKVEQEVIMNTPGKADGAVRLWFDDKLEVEVKAANLREQNDLVVAGVVGSISRGRARGKEQPDNKPTVIQVTPFELRVK